MHGRLPAHACRLRADQGRRVGQVCMMCIHIYLCMTYIYSNDYAM